MKRTGLLCVTGSLLCSGGLLIAAVRAARNIGVDGGGIIGGADAPTLWFCLHGILNTLPGRLTAVLALVLLLCGAVLFLLGTRKKPQ